MNIAVATLLVALPVVAGAQATVEAAAGASRAATSVAGPGQKIGKGVGGTLDKLNRTLQQSVDVKSSPKAAPITVPTVRDHKSPTLSNKATEVSSQKVAETQYEPPSGIREGMDVTELVRRFGPPALRITAGPDETYCYVAKDGASVDATVRGDKVAAVQMKNDSRSGSMATGQHK